MQRLQSTCQNLRTAGLAAGMMASLVVAGTVRAASHPDRIVWGDATPEEQGIRSRDLLPIVDLMEESEGDLHGVIVARNGRVVLEAYAHPYDSTSLHNVKSVSKSLMSLIVGVSLEEGILGSLDQTLGDHFAGSITMDPEGRKREISLCHILTMTSGLDLDENGPIELEITRSLDWVSATLARPLVAEPGSRFLYSTPLTHLASAILTRASGVSLLELAERQILGPLGIEGAQWARAPDGYCAGGNDLFMTPRAMAKIGVLVLAEGRWGDRQIVSTGWIRASTRRHIDIPGRREGYGYWWWLGRSGSIYAEGWGGQLIQLRPRDRLVLVTASASRNATAKVSGVTARLALSDDPLPADPDGVGTLRQAARRLEHPSPGPPTVVPPFAGTVSGTTFVFDDNDLEIESMRLDFVEAGEARMTLAREGRVIAGTIGMDGVYRINDVELAGGMPEGDRLALRGRWTDGQTFELDYHEMGRPSHWLMVAAFDDESLTLTIHMRPLDRTDTLRARRR